MAKALAQFTVTRTGEDYLLSLEDEDGDTIEFIATTDDLDLIAEAMDEAFGAEDEDRLEDEGEVEEE